MPRQSRKRFAGSSMIRRFEREWAQAGRRAVERYYNWDRVISDLVAIGQKHAAVGAREAAS